MATTLLTAGIACIVAAIVGGGLKAFGLEIPALASSRRQIGLGVFGAMLLVAAAVASREGILPAGAQDAAGRAARTSDGGPADASSADCFASALGAVPASRIKHVESGTADLELVAPNEPKDLPVAVVIEERRRPVAAIAFEFFAGSSLFKISRVIDAGCHPVTAFRNSSRGGDKTVLQNWDSVEMTLGAAVYSLRLGYDSGTISGSLTSATP
jgi:hypothetical protein